MTPSIHHPFHLLQRLGVFALMLVSGIAGWASELGDQEAAFSKLADRVIVQAVTGKVDASAAQKDLAAMGELAVWFAGQYQAKFPAGAKTMEFMIQQKPKLPALSLDVIDANFESEAISKTHGKDLGLDLTDEENEHFGNVIDLFVHPATAGIVLTMWVKEPKPELLKRVVSELQEVKEHCQKVVAKLAK